MPWTKIGENRYKVKGKEKDPDARVWTLEQIRAYRAKQANELRNGKRSD